MFWQVWNSKRSLSGDELPLWLVPGTWSFPSLSMRFPGEWMTILGGVHFFNNLIVRMRDTNVSLEYLHPCLGAYIYTLFLIYFLWPAWSKNHRERRLCLSHPTRHSGCEGWARAPPLYLTDSWEFVHDSFFLLWSVVFPLCWTYIPEGFGAFFFSFVIFSLDSFLLPVADLGFVMSRGQGELCLPPTLPCFLTVFSDIGHGNTLSVIP